LEHWEFVGEFDIVLAVQGVGSTIVRNGIPASF